MEQLAVAATGVDVPFEIPGYSHVSLPIWNLFYEGWRTTNSVDVGFWV